MGKHSKHKQKRKHKSDDPTDEVYLESLTKVQALIRGDSDRRLFAKEKKVRKVRKHHDDRYNPRGPWSAPEGYEAESNHHTAATHLQKLVRGNSARKLKEKREKEKARMRQQIANQKAVRARDVETYEEREEKGATSVADAKHMLDTAENSRKEHHRNHDRLGHGDHNQHHHSKPTRASVGAFGAYVAGDTEMHESPRLTKQDEEEMKKVKGKHIEIYASDDEVTKAQKAKMNYLADKKAREEYKENLLERGELKKKSAKSVQNEPKTDEANDNTVLSCLCIFLLLYYGTLVWIGIEMGMWAVSIIAGIILPFGVYQTVKTWKTAKSQGKRAIFLW